MFSYTLSLSLIPKKMSIHVDGACKITLHDYYKKIFTYFDNYYFIMINIIISKY